jgi:hypothetical protein
VPALDESAPGFNSSNFHYLLPVNLLTLGYKPCEKMSEAEYDSIKYMADGTDTTHELGQILRFQELVHYDGNVYFHDLRQHGADPHTPCFVVDEHHDTVRFLGGFPCVHKALDSCYCDDADYSSATHKDYDVGASCNSIRHRDCCAKCWDPEHLEGCNSEWRPKLREKAHHCGQQESDSNPLLGKVHRSRANTTGWTLPKDPLHPHSAIPEAPRTNAYPYDAAQGVDAMGRNIGGLAEGYKHQWPSAALGSRYLYETEAPFGADNKKRNWTMPTHYSSFASTTYATEAGVSSQ